MTVALAAYHFMHDLAGRLANRVQLTTDGHRPYLTAVEDAFGLTKLLCDLSTRACARANVATPSVTIQ
jgi:hypothetical protein